jgi:4-amino-4-deoxy-L-arabinose transferase-like glycosyltransferase
MTSSKWSILLAQSFIAIDPGFSERARLVRYDWIALLSVTLVLYLLLMAIHEKCEYRRSALFCASDFLLGLGVLSHVLYIILLPVLLLAFVLSVDNRLERSARDCLLIIAAFTLTMLA